MPPSESEQTLEWTFQHRLCGKMQAAWFVRDLVLLILLSFIPNLIPFSRIPDAIINTGLICFTLFLFILILYALLYFLTGGRPSRTLRLNRQTIILIDTHAFGVKERRMNVVGAKVRTVHFDFFERLFTFDLYRMGAAYHIEIVQNGETFLFPCADEKEQLQIAGKIKDAGVSA